MEQTAKRLILAAALGLVSVVAVPVFTVGQEYQPRTQVEFEVRELQKQVGKLDEVPVRLAVMQSQLNSLQSGQAKTEDSIDKAFKGLLALAGSFILVILSRFAGALGITFTRKQGE